MMNKEEIKTSIKYFSKYDPDSIRTQDHRSMQVAIAAANLLIAVGSYTILSIKSVDYSDAQ